MPAAFDFDTAISSIFALTMEKMIQLLLVALVVICYAEGVKPDGRKIPRIDRVHQRLKLLNKPPIKTIYSEDGDIVDCVDIHKQPAFDHPALKSHKIQVKPSFQFPSAETTSDSKEPEPASRLKRVSQTWQKSGNCPTGSIPIRRIKKEELLRASSPDRFGRKIYSPSLSASDESSIKNNTRFYPSIKLGQEVNRSTAILFTLGYNYIGAVGDLNIWNPSLGSDSDFSGAQVWLKNGPSEGFESVEAGWVVNPSLYGDRRTRLSIHWTVDSYKSTGCFDLTCSGFIQTDPHIALGTALDTISGEGGDQYVLPVALTLDSYTGNWWVIFGNDTLLGYWPGNLFGYLNHSATLVEWGGEVFSSNLSKSPHTTTAMGSGNYASDLFGSACFVMRPRIMDYSLTLKYPRNVFTYADEPYCYNGLNFQVGYTMEPVFFFGGPGQNNLCP